MKLVRRSTGLLVTLGVVAVGSAAANPARSAFKFSTGSFVVSCTSSGELCSPAEKLRFRLHRSGTLKSITYTTAATHCSTVQLHVLLRGHEIAKTGILPAGKATERLTTHVALRKGATTLGFKAQGFVNGCNVGRVISWGGKVTVTVKT